MLERRGAIIRIDDMAGLLVEESNPLGKLSGVGYSSAEEDLMYTIRKEDNGLLPDHASLLLPHVVDLIKNNPTQLSCHFRTTTRRQKIERLMERSTQGNLVFEYQI